MAPGSKTYASFKFVLVGTEWSPQARLPGVLNLLKLVHCSSGEVLPPVSCVSLYQCVSLALGVLVYLVALIL